MHVVRESAGAARNPVHHLLVIAKGTMRHAEIHDNLSMALGAVATINGQTHGGIMDLLTWRVDVCRHRAYTGLRKACESGRIGQRGPAFTIRNDPLLARLASTKLQRPPLACKEWGP